jgi:hypothetical protein
MHAGNRPLTALLWLTCFTILSMGGAPQTRAEAATTSGAEVGITAGPPLYLPLVFKSYQYVPARRANAPYINVPDVTTTHLHEMAIFWFGKVTQTENYADVRVGYNDTTLYVYVAAFDRRLWYDTSPAASDLTSWDALSLYLNTSGNSGSAPTTNSHRFVVQFEGKTGGTSPSYRAAYQGNGAAWVTASTAFSTYTTYRGTGGPNTNSDNRGWVSTFQIPFASLGVSAPPAQGTVWGLSVVMHDRDSSSGSPAIADKTWPEANVDLLRPATWGQLAFGLPTYSPPGYSSSSTVTIGEGLNGAVVPDAAVGGTGSNLCGSGLDYWTQWGEAIHGSDMDFAIQNESDISDFPCFAKYYVTFPLTALPSGKVIITATLTLHQMGGSGNPASDALIQVMTVGQDWSESTITWNNAPLADENEAGRTWVSTVVGCGGSIAWPCVPRTWDVSRAVARAYAAGQPLRLVLYSADSAYNTGKYFTSSETGSWNAAGRPQLDVRWGNP